MVFNAELDRRLREGIVEDTLFKPRPAADYADFSPSFVWNPYIPRGDFTVLMAPGGVGKTIFCCGIAAAISRGVPLPGEQDKRTPGNVLLVSAEDTGELLKDRLQKCGADLSRVFILDCISSAGFNFIEGLEDFQAQILRCNADLVVVDPWHGFAGEDLDLNRVNAVRPVFQRLAGMAKACDCGLILVSHVNKKLQGENANNAATGSTDFVNAARSALRVVFDEAPGADNRRIVVHTKANYTAPGRSLRYIIEDGGLRWDGFSNLTRQTLEAAARQHKTPFEAQQKAVATEESNAALIDACRDYASPGESVKITYDKVVSDYGADIFAGRQPKRALDSIRAELLQHGVDLQTGISIWTDGKSRNGFMLTMQKAADEWGEGLLD